MTAGPYAAARALLAGHHQPAAMSHAELQALLARYQKCLHELAGAAGGAAGGPPLPVYEDISDVPCPVVELASRRRA